MDEESPQIRHGPLWEKSPRFCEGIAGPWKEETPWRQWVESGGVKEGPRGQGKRGGLWTVPIVLPTPGEVGGRGRKSQVRRLRRNSGAEAFRAAGSRDTPVRQSPLPPGFFANRDLPEPPGPVQDGAAKIRIVSRRRGRERTTAWMGDPIPHRTLCAAVGSGLGHACEHQTRLRRRGKDTERNWAFLRSSATRHEEG